MMIRYLISRYGYQILIPLYNRVSFINGPKPYRYQISKKSSLKNFFFIQHLYFFYLQNHIRNRFLASLRNTFFVDFFSNRKVSNSPLFFFSNWKVSNSTLFLSIKKGLSRRSDGVEKSSAPLNRSGILGIFITARFRSFLKPLNLLK